MSKFPNYRTVEVAEGVTAKVAPLRLHREESFKALAALSVLLDGDVGKFMRMVPDVTPALALSLSENHTKAECDKVMNALGYSLERGSPFYNVMKALLGRDPIGDDDADDQQ